MTRKLFGRSDNRLYHERSNEDLTRSGLTFGGENMSLLLGEKFGPVNGLEEVKGLLSLGEILVFTIRFIVFCWIFIIFFRSMLGGLNDEKRKLHFGQ